MNTDRILSVTLTVAAVSLAATVLYREIAPARSGASAYSPPVLREDWRSLHAKGRSLYDANAPIQLLEFSDLECPACRHFHRTTLPQIREKFRDKVNVTYVHFPLSFHRFAKPAAVAAECAGEQGRFVQFIEGVFAKQDSIGLKPWSAFAMDAGLADSAAFTSCTLRPEVLALVDVGRALADSLQVKATPTVLVNGWEFATPPSAETLSRAIEALLAGQTLKNWEPPR